MATVLEAKKERLKKQVKAGQIDRKDYQARLVALKDKEETLKSKGAKGTLLRESSSSKKAEAAKKDSDAKAADKKKTFGQAFKEARAKGINTIFTWNGKKYKAVTKDDLKKQNKK